MPDAGGSSLDTPRGGPRRPPDRPPRAAPHSRHGRRRGCSARTSSSLLAAAGYDVLAPPKAELDIADARQVVARACGSSGPTSSSTAPPSRRSTTARPILAPSRSTRGLSRIWPTPAVTSGRSSCRSRPTSSSTARRATPYRRGRLRSNHSRPTGRSKRAGEEEALRLPGSLVVRASWLFGRSGWNFVEAILKQVESGQTRGSRSWSTRSAGPTSTTDLSEAILALLEAGASGVYHFANRGEVSWNEFAREILWLAGQDGHSGRSDDLRGARAPGAPAAVLGARHGQVREADGPPDPALSRSPRRVPGAARAAGGVTWGQSAVGAVSGKRKARRG